MARAFVLRGIPEGNKDRVPMAEEKKELLVFLEQCGLEKGKVLVVQRMGAKDLRRDTPRLAFLQMEAKHLAALESCRVAMQQRDVSWRDFVPRAKPQGWPGEHSTRPSAGLASGEVGSKGRRHTRLISLPRGNFGTWLPHSARHTS